MPVRQKKMDSSGSCEKSARSITELEKSGLKMTRRRVKMSSGWKGGDPKNFRAASLLPPKYPLQSQSIPEKTNNRNESGKN